MNDQKTDALQRAILKQQNRRAAAKKGAATRAKQKQARKLWEARCRYCGKPPSCEHTKIVRPEGTLASRLQRAIDALGAVEVAPGRYALPNGKRDDGNHVGPWAIVPEALLTDVSPYLRKEAVEMPSWWTPERRTIWRISDTPGKPILNRVHYETNGYEAVKYLNAYGEASVKVEAITADLTTGEEVPA